MGFYGVHGFYNLRCSKAFAGVLELVTHRWVFRFSVFIYLEFWFVMDIGLFWSYPWLRGAISEGFGNAPIPRPNGHIGSSWNGYGSRKRQYRGVYRTHRVILLCSGMIYGQP
jgi:hypothetical protein